MAADLPRKPEIIAFNKIDALRRRNSAAKLADFKRRIRKTPILMSGATGQNVDEAMKKLLSASSRGDRAAARSDAEARDSRRRWRP